MKHTICRKVRKFKKQNTILVSHLNRKLILFNLIDKILILFIFGVYLALGASITNICFTANVLVFILLMLVKIFVSSYNPQITKARVIYKKLHKSNITLNSGLSMRVGISEAIRMLFYFSLKIFIPFFKKINLNLLNKALHFIPVILTSLIDNRIEIMHVRKSKAKYEKEEIFSKIGQFKPLTSSFEKIKSKNLKPEDQKFNQWLAGLIDGDGCFQLSKKGYASLEIVAHIRDKNCLYQIKQKFGGAVKLRANLNHLRFRMHHKHGMLDIITAVNGEIRNPVRLLQLSKICDKYNIPVIQPTPLNYDNAWFSGFFDSDGSIYLNLKSSQMLITAGQKNKFLLDLLSELYGGSVYIEKTSFK